MKLLEIVFPVLLLWVCMCPSIIRAQIGFGPSSSYGGYPSISTQNHQQQQPYFQYTNPSGQIPTYPVTLGIPHDKSLVTTPTVYSARDANPSCRGQLIGDEYKYVCTGPTPTLSRKYILWLQAGRTRPIRIEVPNYKLDDWIEAGFKRSPGPHRSLINVFVRKPEISAHASAEETAPQEPDVNLEYEPVLQTTRHFGTDEVRIVAPGVIQEPQRFGGGGGINDGRQQIQYKRDVSHLEPRPMAQAPVSAKAREHAPVPMPASTQMSAISTSMQAPVPMWSGMWIPLSGPNGHRLQF